MEKLILIDGSGLIYRSFYAVPPFMRSPEGIQTNAVFGFANILFALFNKYDPDYVAIAFDKRGPTFRHVQYPEYKATRVKAPDALYAQIPIVKDLVRSFKMPALETDGFEADDVIATVAYKLGHEKNLEILIATGDFDIFQAVSENVKILYPTSGFKDAKVFHSHDIKEKYGVRPDQIPDYKALRGDPSDNIPGVRGIGPKTACTLLDKFETLENIYLDLEKVFPESVRKKLSDSKENAFLSKDLATLRKDAPIDFELADCRVSSFNKKSATDFFEKLGFKTLIKRFNQKEAPQIQESQPALF